MPYFYYDSMLWVVLAVAVIGMIASSRVQSTFRKYSKMPARTACARATWRSACFSTAGATRSSPAFPAR